MAFVIEDDAPVASQTARFVLEDDVPPPVQVAPPSPSMLDKYLSWQKENLGSVIEPALQMGSGAISSAVGGLVGAAAAPFVGANEASDIIRNIQQKGTYEPTTTSGKAVSGALESAMNYPSKGWEQLGGAVGEAIYGEKGRDIGESVGGVIWPVTATVAPAPTMLRQARTAAANKAITKAQEQTAAIAKVAPTKLESARVGNEMGLKFMPDEFADTAGMRLKTKIADRSKTEFEAAVQNQPIYTSRIRQQISGDPNFAPTKENLTRLAAETAAPYAEVAQSVPLLTDVAGITTKLESLRPPSDVVGVKSGMKRVNSLIDESVNAVQQGMTGKGALDSISALREQVRDIYNGTHPKIRNKAVAKRLQSVADTLEDAIDSQLITSGQSALMQNLRDARVKLAQIKVVEDITDPITGVIYPNKLTTGAAAKAQLTGDLAKIRNFAADFPKTMASPIKSESHASQAISRSGVTGTLGAGVGATVGMPVTGGLIGGAIEALQLSPYLRRGLLSSETQGSVLPQRLSSPVDIPPPPLGLAPLESLPPSTPAPAPKTRGLLSLADDEATVRVSAKPPETKPFDLKLDVMNKPEVLAATQAFQAEAIALKEILNNRYIIDKRVKAETRAKLNAVEDEFMAGLKQLGYKNESQVRNLMRKLYEGAPELAGPTKTGNPLMGRTETQLPIERTFNPRGMMSQ